MQQGVISVQNQGKQPEGSPPAVAGEMTIVFDGDCPVCTAYSCNIAIDQPNKIVNARNGGALVDELTAAGIDLDEGMVVIHEGKHYHGADAVQIMALHSAKGGLLSRLNHLVFRSRARSRALYPILRFGRNTLLRILGRTRINKARRN
ncbi:MAG: DCC1-like thiol-disulfide oxidoreductase family protein [Steroidobacteraceae bacterium]